MTALGRRPRVVGFLVAVPIAALAAWFGGTFLAPTPQYPIDLGPARELAFALAALVAGTLPARRLAHEELGTASGLAVFWLVATIAAPAFAAVGAAAQGWFLDGAGVVAFLLSAVASVGMGAVLWVPAGIVWVAAVRRLTIAGLRRATEMELAESEAARDAAAREHVRVDALMQGDQGSRLRRNRP